MHLLPIFNSGKQKSDKFNNNNNNNNKQLIIYYIPMTMLKCFIWISFLNITRTYEYEIGIAVIFS